MRGSTALAVLLVPALAACSEPPEVAGPGTAILTFETPGGPVTTGHLEVARTPSERERGLAGRPWIPEDGGMVFIFEEPTRTSFWMRGTPVQLSIAFWDDGGRIVDILDMKPCRTEPCPLYTARSDYVAAAEMRRGWFGEHGVEVGDAVELRLE